MLQVVLKMLAKQECQTSYASYKLEKWSTQLCAGEHPAERTQLHGCRCVRQAWVAATALPCCCCARRPPPSPPPLTRPVRGAANTTANLCPGDGGAPLIRKGGKAAGDLLVGLTGWRSGKCVLNEFFLPGFQAPSASWREGAVPLPAR